MAKSSSGKRKAAATFDRTTPADDFVFKAGAAALKPEGMMLTSQWADKNIRVSSVSAPEPGPYRTERTPYAREIMDSLSPVSPIKHCYFMKGSQIGGTTIGHNAIGSWIDLAPGPILYAMPTVDFAKEYSKTRIQVMINDCEVLSAKVKDARSRDSGNTTLLKEFPGGFLSMVGSNAPSALKGKPIRYFQATEIDEFHGDVGGQGDPISLGVVRTRNFSRRKKIYLEGTPTVEGRSRISYFYKLGDQRKFFVPCMKCGHMQWLRWSQISWMKSGDNAQRARSAVYLCEKCDASNYDFQKTMMFENGVWRPTKGDVDPSMLLLDEFGAWRLPDWDGETVSYHLSALYSPHGWFSWQDCVKAFLDAAEDREQLKVVVNTIMGETFQERGDAPDYEILEARAEKYQRGTVPKGGLLLTVGVDVQKDRMECEIVAWGRGKESWSVDYRIIPGNPEEETPWRMLDQLLQEMFPTESGANIPITTMAIDSGAFTQYVYAYCRRHPPARVLAVKGMANLSTVLGHPKAVDITIRGKTIANGVKVWGAGVGIVKMEFYSNLRLRRDEDGSFPRGYIHFPAYDTEWFKQITSEQLQVTHKKKSNAVTYEWVLIPGRRNEGLDSRVYARVAAAAAGVDRMTDEHWASLDLHIHGKESVRPSIPVPGPVGPQAHVADVRGPQRGTLSKGIRADWHSMEWD